MRTQPNGEGQAVRAQCERSIWNRIRPLVLGGVSAILLMAGATTLTSEVSPPSDLRLMKLSAFFDKYRCPERGHALEYIRAADRNHLDYRLLPAISFVESTCGMAQRSNNHWGWNSANTGFESFESGLRFVAAYVATGVPYRGKDLDQKLRTYNPDPAYAPAVRKVMREIAEVKFAGEGED